jgi:hypothetical protein
LRRLALAVAKSGEQQLANVDSPVPLAGQRQHVDERGLDVHAEARA